MHLLVSYLLILILCQQCLSLEDTITKLDPAVDQGVKQNPGNSFDDVRCKCVCPALQAAKNDTSPDSKRRLYVGNVERDQCTCDSVVLPFLKDKVEVNPKEFCPRCECRYQSRNTQIIKWVIIFIVVVLACLVVYMGFLMFFDPYLHKNSRTMYQEHVDEVVLEEQHPTSGGADDGNTGRRRLTTVNSVESTTSITSGTKIRPVLRLVEEQQSKWKRQILEQRRNIYDKHTMLN